MVAADGGCCKCCFSFIITLGLTALFLWLSLRTNEPKCYVESFYVPALNQTLKTTSNSTIVFQIGFDNGNKDKGIQYDNVNVTVGIFLDLNKTRLIGNSTIAGFYQGHQKNAKKPDFVDAHGGELNRTAKLHGNNTYFRVDFTTSVKYKILLWYTKRHSLWGGANVPVDGSGNKVGKKGIRLGHTVAVISGAPLLAGCYCTLLIVGIFVNFLFLNMFL